jgi:hypothetical protein
MSVSQFSRFSVSRPDRTRRKSAPTRRRRHHGRTAGVARNRAPLPTGVPRSRTLSARASPQPRRPRGVHRRHEGSEIRLGRGGFLFNVLYKEGPTSTSNKTFGGPIDVGIRGFVFGGSRPNSDLQHKEKQRRNLSFCYPDILQSKFFLDYIRLKFGFGCCRKATNMYAPVLFPFDGHCILICLNIF